MKLVIFAIPKPFKDPHIITIQHNALASWTQLHDTQVIIFGKEVGFKKALNKYQIIYKPKIAKSEQGTPLLSDAFSHVQTRPADVYMYINSDIIVFPELIKSLKYLLTKYNNFLAVGHRTDIDITELIDFSNKKAVQKLKKDIVKKGQLHSEHGIDYFAFTPNVFPKIPEFRVGRAGFDNWLIYSARKRKFPVVDITQVNTVLHQNHDYRHIKLGKKAAYTGVEARINKSLAGNNNGYCTLRDCSHILKKGSTGYVVEPMWKQSWLNMKYFLLWTLPRIQHPIGRIIQPIRQFFDNQKILRTT